MESTTTYRSPFSAGTESTYPTVIVSPGGKEIPVRFQSYQPPRSGGATHRPSVSHKISSKRVGGRALGSHLDPEKAAKTKAMREQGSCWLCCLQRDSCTPGPICDRCSKRNSRPQSDHGLGCDRTKLADLRDQFLPDLITAQHQPHALKSFVAEHVGRWLGQTVRVKIQLIWDMPKVNCEMYEFEPKTNELEHQLQYLFNRATGTQEVVQKRSPPMAMTQIENSDRKQYDNFLNEVVAHFMPAFAQRRYGCESDDFQLRLLKLMISLKEQERGKEEQDLMRQVFRLLVAKYIMARTATIADEDREATLRQLRSYRGGLYDEGNCSPRMANRQLKYLFLKLETDILTEVLKRLQQILRSSKGGNKWTSAFVAILGLAMVHEDTQRMVHVHSDSQWKRGHVGQGEAQRRAEEACRTIDERFGFVMTLFRWKYNRTFNPLRDLEDAKTLGCLGERVGGFVKDVHALIMEKHDYLMLRQHVPIATENPSRYTSRLVARFLLSFWSPC
ncbi:hypothetical protein LTS18_013006 [Coniosporium uncinatum]|uniref:Uncharacterized protein n=1 Tax=Coniosporium uncinatum TaxID=93489 RepID=A0ACC3DVN6_9PEZI|nr:hypothetical protein LTS18_013006 [Coniosporium uncinatum]